MNAIIEMIVLCIIALISAVFAAWYQNYYLNGEKERMSVVLKSEKKSLIIFMGIFVFFAAASVMLNQYKENALNILCENQICWSTILLIAIIDFKMKKIPNHLLLFLLAARGGFLIVQIILKPSQVLSLILFSIVGFIVGGLVMFACLLVSRGGVGEGDMKLFAIIGAYFGFSGVMSIMLYSLFLAAIVSITLLICRKAKLKSTLAMAPFISAGLTIYIALF